MKQTAVELLEIKILLSLRIWDKKKDDFNMPEWLSELIKKAKEMEKQQIIDAYQQGFNNAYFNNPLSKEQYYNEKYNK